VLELLERRGAAAYLGEPVTVREHLLQCAALAEEAGEAPELVAACLLHDIGWLIGTAPGRADRYGAEQPGHDHAERGAEWLARRFPPAVSEPVRLHVAAKRYLVATEPGRLEVLSDESRRTLALQGGPFDPGQVARFESGEHAGAAVRLRRFDDAAKVPGRHTAPLRHYAALLDALGATCGVTAGEGATAS
jgi:gamma-butyrobetaine dioxygenase